jgi:hypothetical protein
MASKKNETKKYVEEVKIEEPTLVPVRDDTEKYSGSKYAGPDYDDTAKGPLPKNVEDALRAVRPLIADVPTPPAMCKLPVTNLQTVCDWLNGDSMPLPQNEIRKALALLLVATACE